MQFLSKNDRWDHTLFSEFKSYHYLRNLLFPLIILLYEAHLKKHKWYFK
jgi:hypothetical protein